MTEPEVTEAPDAARRRHAELSVEIAENDYRYYILDSPLVSDAEYDKLMREIRALEERYGAAHADRPPSDRLRSPPSSPRCATCSGCSASTAARRWARRLRGAGRPGSAAGPPPSGIRQPAVAPSTGTGRWSGATRGDSTTGKTSPPTSAPRRATAHRFWTCPPNPRSAARCSSWWRGSTNSTRSSARRSRCSSGPPSAPPRGRCGKEPKITASRPFRPIVHGLVVPGADPVLPGCPSQGRSATRKRARYPIELVRPAAWGGLHQRLLRSCPT